MRNKNWYHHCMEKKESPNVNFDSCNSFLISPSYGNFTKTAVFESVDLRKKIKDFFGF